MKNFEVRGFTLTELMITVTIIGLLASIAIPSFQSYQSKSKTTEAKLRLSKLYDSQYTIFLEHGLYATCFDALAVAQVQNSNYAIGFASVGTADADLVASGESCSGVFRLAATKTGGAPATYLAVGNFDTETQSITASSSGFEAGAIGHINKNSTAPSTTDTWLIDETKSLRQDRVGF